MSKYRDQLPQLTNAPFITDGGLEMSLIFERGYDLPEMAAFDQLIRRCKMQ
jgi:homocysteine S-methyltransferase